MPAQSKFDRVAAFRLGDWTVDPSTDTIYQKNKVVHVQPKVMDLLVYLADNSKFVVSKEDLMNQLWPDSFVSETALARSISELRHSLGDTSQNSRFIETIPKRGYRLVVDPTREDSTSFSKHSAVLKLSGIFVIGFSLMTLIIYNFWWHNGFVVKDASVAVMPFVDGGISTEKGSFCQVITKEIIFRLSKINNLRVDTRYSQLPYRDGLNRPAEQKWNTDNSYILNGNFSRENGILKLSARLVDPHSNTNLWSEDYELPLEKTLDIPIDIARQISSTLNLKETLVKKEKLHGDLLRDPQSHEKFLLANHFREFETKEGFQKAIEYYHQAISKEQNFPEAYAGLAEAYFLLGRWNHGEDMTIEAQKALSEALLLNGDSPDVLVTKGILLARLQKDYAGAENAYIDALRINPDHAQARREYGLLLLRDFGRLDEALINLKRAQELSPLSGRIASNLFELYRIRGDFEKALQTAKRHFELNSANPRASRNLALSYYLIGENTQALYWLNISIYLQPNLTDSFHCGRSLQLLSLIYLNEGRLDDAEQTSRTLLSLDPFSPQGIAMAGVVALWRGNYERARINLSAAHKLDPDAFLWPRGIRLSTLYGYVLLKTGDRSELNRVLFLSATTEERTATAEKKVIRPDRIEDIAAVNSILGKTDESYLWLNRAVQVGWKAHVFIENDPLFENVRKEPEFQLLVDKLNSNNDHLLETGLY